jgi:hypothetical protein
VYPIVPKTTQTAFRPNLVLNQFAMVINQAPQTKKLKKTHYYQSIFNSHEMNCYLFFLKLTGRKSTIKK